MAYELKEPTRVAISHPMHGMIRASFDAGSNAPKSEQEEIALEHLVKLGHATHGKAAERGKAPDKTKEHPGKGKGLTKTSEGSDG